MIERRFKEQIYQNLDYLTNLPINLAVKSEQRECMRYLPPSTSQ